MFRKEEGDVLHQLLAHGVIVTCYFQSTEYVVQETLVPGAGAGAGAGVRVVAAVLIARAGAGANPTCARGQAERNADPVGETLRPSSFLEPKVGVGVVNTGKVVAST